MVLSKKKLLELLAQQKQNFESARDSANHWAGRMSATEEMIKLLETEEEKKDDKEALPPEVGQDDGAKPDAKKVSSLIAAKIKAKKKKGILDVRPN